MAKKIVIAGAGEIGKALGSVLGERGHRVEYYDRDPDKIRGERPLEESLPEADMLLLCVPSWALRDTLIKISPLLPQTTIVVSTAKGIEAKSQKTADEVLFELLSRNRPFAMLGGPLLAEEVIQNMSSVGVAASNDHKAFQLMEEVFSGSRIALEYSAHVHQVTLSGILKNIYALALGIADGLGWGSNSKGWLTAQIISEMEIIFGFLGFDSDIVRGTAGVGDLIATGFSAYSRNRQAGSEIARTGHSVTPCEGIVSLPSLASILGERVGRLPLLTTLMRIVSDQENARRGMEEYFLAATSVHSLE